LLQYHHIRAAIWNQSGLIENVPVERQTSKYLGLSQSFFLRILNATHVHQPLRHSVACYIMFTTKSIGWSRQAACIACRWEHNNIICQQDGAVPKTAQMKTIVLWFVLVLSFEVCQESAFALLLYPQLPWGARSHVALVQTGSVPTRGTIVGYRLQKRLNILGLVSKS
jgi:hypothetical protein